MWGNSQQAEGLGSGRADDNRVVREEMAPLTSSSHGTTVADKIEERIGTNPIKMGLAVFGARKRVEHCCQFLYKDHSLSVTFGNA